MECSVCYCESGSFCTLTCGHAFCKGCIKTWYLKGTGTGCPMCRKAIHFKGFAKVREQWDEEACETRCTEVLDQAMTAAIEEAFEFCAGLPLKSKNLRKMILNSLMEDLADIEKTARFLKSWEVSPDELEYWLMETDEYFSDRHIGQYRWMDEPQKEFATKYPRIARGGGKTSSQRCRARPDEWYTLSFVFSMV